MLDVFGSFLFVSFCTYITLQQDSTCTNFGCVVYLRTSSRANISVKDQLKGFGSPSTVKLKAKSQSTSKHFFTFTSFMVLHVNLQIIIYSYHDNGSLYCEIECVRESFGNEGWIVFSHYTMLVINNSNILVCYMIYNTGL